MRNNIEHNKTHFIENLFVMIENAKFDLEFSNINEINFNRKVTNLIEKTDEELKYLWFNFDDIIQFRLKTNHKLFISTIMELIDDGWNELADYVCKISPYNQINIWFKYTDLELLEWVKKRASK